MMKKSILIILVLINFKMLGQVPILNIKSYHDEGIGNAVLGDYIKDINNEYSNFIGNWVWTNADQKITFKIKKITQHFFISCECYSDFLVADYIYTTNYEQNTVLNSSLNNLNSSNPNDYPMFSIGPSYNNQNIINFAFEDILIQKHNTGNAEAIFTRIPGTTNQMSLVLKNPSGPQLMFPGDPPPNFNFSLPSGITVTKQP